MEITQLSSPNTTQVDRQALIKSLNQQNSVKPNQNVPFSSGNGRFSQLLSLTLANSAASPASPGIGSDSGGLMTPLLLMLLEQLLARGLESEPVVEESPLMSDAFQGQHWQDPNDSEVGGGRMAVGVAKGGTGTSGYSTNKGIQGIVNMLQTQHINQFDAERQAGGDGRNANCGPTSLVMALHALGLRIKGENVNTSIGKLVDLARLSMSPGAARDGVDAKGNRVESEHSTYTNFGDLARGAAAAGASPRRLLPTVQAIQSALQSGASVIASGTFSGKSPLPWTGDRGIDNQSAPGGATAHIIAITGFLPDKNLFVVHDPARRSEIQVSADALERFMRGNAGALAITA